LPCFDNSNRYKLIKRISQYFFILHRRTPQSTLFPYTTLFRSTHRSDIGCCFLLMYSTNRNSCEYLMCFSRKFHQHIKSFFSILRSEEHTSELQSRENLVCRLLLEKKNNSLNKITLEHDLFNFT